MSWRTLSEQPPVHVDRIGRIVIVVLLAFCLWFNKSVGVEGETLARHEEELTVIRVRSQKRLQSLQVEGHRCGDQFRVVVRKINVLRFAENTCQSVDGLLLERAGEHTQTQDGQ
jgi:hypothetical protein